MSLEFNHHLLRERGKTKRRRKRNKEGDGIVSLHSSNHHPLLKRILLFSFLFSEDKLLLPSPPRLSMSPPSGSLAFITLSSSGLPSFFTRSPSPLLPPTSNRRSTSTSTLQSPQERFDQALREDDERFNHARTTRNGRGPSRPLSSGSSPPPPPRSSNQGNDSSIMARPSERGSAARGGLFDERVALEDERLRREAAGGAAPRTTTTTTRRAQSPSPEDFDPTYLNHGGEGFEWDSDDDGTSYQETTVGQPGSNTFLASTSERESSPYPFFLPPPPPPPPSLPRPWVDTSRLTGTRESLSWLESGPLSGALGARPFPSFPPPSSSSSSSQQRDRDSRDRGPSAESAPPPRQSRRCSSCNSLIFHIDSPVGGSYCGGCGIVIEGPSEQPHEPSDGSEDDEDPISLRPILPPTQTSSQSRLSAEQVAAEQHTREAHRQQREALDQLLVVVGWRIWRGSERGGGAMEGRVDGS
ncbi:hypothetical protein BDY24DRAFT_216114 [Mrakia frigida]|uniref:uncharacterized protein n=1 Tax=Mrakia frigida TaxID=29902 RepID=UPI003FCC1A28